MPETAATKPLSLFVLEILLWLPIMFGLWYLAAEPLTLPLNWLVEHILTGFWPHWFSDIEQSGTVLDVVTTFPLPLQGLQTHETALMVFSLNTMIYSYSLPFLLALSFAVKPGKLPALLLCWLLVLLPAQVWGVVFDVLKTLIFQTSPDIATQLDTSAWQRNLVALAYQLGNLIFPTVIPLVLWISLHWSYVQQRVAVRENTDCAD